MNVNLLILLNIVEHIRVKRMAELLRGTLNFLKIAYSDLQQKNKYVSTLKIMMNWVIIRVKGF
jgi:hypothetical protein